MTRKLILPALAATAGFLGATGTAFADPGYGYGGYGSHPMMWGNWFMGPVMMIVTVVVIAVAVVLVMKLFGFGGHHHGARKQTPDNALAILNERFAKGEIDKAEYEDRKKTLGG